MPDILVRPAGSFIQGPLPTGCAMCSRGAKMVLFVTGVCHYKCFYCPISGEKRMSRDTWANERRITAEDGSDADLQVIAEEGRRMNARGTGMTGGDPMYDPERTLRYIRFLKSEFGPKHHIHLYTQIPFDPKHVAALEEAGLDEFRAHVPEEIWDDPDAHPRYVRVYDAALASGMEVGAEVPCIPGYAESLWNLVRWLDAKGFKFLNLNEMEFSETNYAQLLARGMRVIDDETMRADASEVVARDIMQRARDANLSIALHFCSSPFKDRVQLRERLKRQAEKHARAFEEVTEDGTVVRGVIECDDPFDVRNALARDHDVPPRFTAVADGAVHVAPWALEDVGPYLPWPCYLSEVYPTADEMEVERVPVAKFVGEVAYAKPRAEGKPKAMRPGGW